MMSSCTLAYTTPMLGHTEVIHYIFIVYHFNHIRSLGGSPSQHFISTFFNRYLPGKIKSASQLLLKAKATEQFVQLQTYLLKKVLENCGVLHSHFLVLEWTSESTIVGVGI